MHRVSRVRLSFLKLTEVMHGVFQTSQGREEEGGAFFVRLRPINRLRQKLNVLITLQ